MKKIYFFLALPFMLAGSMDAQVAQTSSVSALKQASFENFIPQKKSVDATAVDHWAVMNGNITGTNFLTGASINIQNDLNAGKYVILDLSAAWCGPCYTLHQTGVLENLLTAYGPSGTDELRVYWLDLETTNTAAQISGTSTANSYAGYSAGDFTAGGTWAVPIIDLTTAQYNATMTAVGELYEGYVPTIMLVCPNGYYKVITTATQYDAYYGTTTYVHAQLGNCPAPTDVPNAEIIMPYRAQTGESVTIGADVYSVVPITAYAWTFQHPTVTSSANSSATLAWNTVGNYNVTLSVSNANGSSALQNSSIRIFDCPTPPYPFTEDFSGADYQPDCWTLTDEELSFAYQEKAVFDGYNYEEGSVELGLPIMNFTGRTPELSFDLAYSGYKYGTATYRDDVLKVEVSANNGQTWQTLYNKTGAALQTVAAINGQFIPTTSQWRRETVDLSSLAGNAAALIRFNFTAAYGNFLWIDNVSITEKTSAIEKNLISPVNIFGTDNSIVFDGDYQTATIYDLTGKTLAADLNGNKTVSVRSGVYLVKVTVEGKEYIQKVVVK